MNRDITVSSIETGPYCVNTYFVRLNNSDECVVIDPADAGKVNTYLSIEEMQIKTKVSKSIIESLKNIGALEGLPESSQMSLF